MKFLVSLICIGCRVPDVTTICHGHHYHGIVLVPVHGSEELVGTIARCGCELNPFQLCTIHVCQCGPVASISN